MQETHVQRRCINPMKFAVFADGRVSVTSWSASNNINRSTKGLPHGWNQATFETASLLFIDANGGGLGLRLRKPQNVGLVSTRKWTISPRSVKCNIDCMCAATFLVQPRYTRALQTARANANTIINIFAETWSTPLQPIALDRKQMS
jgi:hypothetical protein